VKLTEPPAGPPDAADLFASAVREQVWRLDVAEEAKRQRGQRESDLLLADLPASRSLTELLGEDLGDTDYLVDQLWPEEGNVLLAAPDKAGKSTLLGNLVRALVDGDLFLDHFKTRQVQRVVLVDNELSPRLLQKWLRDQGVVNSDRVQVETLRGRVGTFNLLNPHLFAEWVRRVQGADVLLLDVLRPVLDAAGLSEDKEAGQFLRGPLASLAAEAGVGHLFVSHHTGHEGTRARGDSALKDWPDAKWALTKPRGEYGPRAFEAFGRDVALKPHLLQFEPQTRRLVLDPEEVAVSRDPDPKRGGDPSRDADLLETWDPPPTSVNNVRTRSPLEWNPVRKREAHWGTGRAKAAFEVFEHRRKTSPDSSPKPEGQ